MKYLDLNILSKKREARGRMYMVQTIAGSENRGYRDGIGKEVLLEYPSGMVISRDGKDLFVSDFGNGCIRKISLVDGTTSTIVGKSSIMEGIAFRSFFLHPVWMIQILKISHRKKVSTKMARFQKPCLNIHTESHLIETIT